LIIERATMQIAKIVAEADYTQTLAEIRLLAAAEPDRTTPEGSRLDTLTCIAEAFEAEVYALDLADIDAR
jgi:antitoxin component HigA of HigAB toxin-antitoxin module